MTPSNALAAELASHEHFVRRTLRGLLRDENEVNDVVQETWLQALGRSSHGAVGGPWLARTARNIAITRWRSVGRRRAREQVRAQEQASGHARASGPASGSLQRVEERTRVIQAIVSLAEPYRDVVLLRYEEGLSVRAIADRRDASESTVRSQLSRAHALLRSRLDADFGDRRQWAVLAMPATIAGARMIPAAALALTGAAAAVLGVGTWQWATRTLASDAEPLTVAHAARPAGGAAAFGSLGLGAIAPLQDDARKGRVAAALPRGKTHLRLPAAELLDREYYDDYELATFSFLRGLREDPTRDLVQNDWDLQLSGGQFSVNMVTDDRSAIADLTAIGPHELAVALDWNFQFEDRRIDVHEGHTYVVLTRDGDSDIATVVHVTEFVPGRRCTLEWLSTDGSGRSQGSLRDEHVGGKKLSGVLETFRASRAGSDPLAEPRARLQVRSGAVGGNPCRISMTGATSGYIRKTSSTPLDVTGEVAMNEPSLAYLEGGGVPAGQTFVVTRVTYRGSSRGDSNGKGRFEVVVGGQMLASMRSMKDPIDEVWTGEIRIRPGDEETTSLTVSNSSAGEVILEGRFEAQDDDQEGRPWARNPGFFEDVTGIVAAEITKHFVPLTTPDIVLQVRAGAGGGNPNRVDMRGRTSIYVDHERDEPLDFSEPVTMKTESEAYVLGGSIPKDKVFVVTGIDYVVTATGDSNGGGYVKLRVGGRDILDVRKSEGSVEDVWRGRLILRADEESRTYLEVGNSSTANVTIQGFLQ